MSRWAGPNAAGDARDYLQRGLMIGGFALIALAVRIGSSGIKTFLVNHDDIKLPEKSGAGYRQSSAGDHELQP